MFFQDRLLFYVGFIFPDFVASLAHQLFLIFYLNLITLQLSLFCFSRFPKNSSYYYCNNSSYKLYWSCSCSIYWYYW